MEVQRGKMVKVKNLRDKARTKTETAKMEIAKMETAKMGIAKMVIVKTENAKMVTAKVTEMVHATFKPDTS